MKWSERLEEYRVRHGPYASPPRASYGAFYMPGPCGAALRILAADATDPVVAGWEHVSVSADRRIPNWIEMSFVKDLFWDENECVVQFHPPKSQHVNNHPRCLHLWRWTQGDFPQPPSTLVGVKALGELERSTK